MSTFSRTAHFPSLSLTHALVPAKDFSKVGLYLMSLNLFNLAETNLNSNPTCVSVLTGILVSVVFTKNVKGSGTPTTI